MKTVTMTFEIKDAFDEADLRMTLKAKDAHLALADMREHLLGLKRGRSIQKQFDAILEGYGIDLEGDLL